VVQQAVETALAAVAREPIVLHCAGRTDTGVHALAQVCHFDAPVERPLGAMLPLHHSQSGYAVGLVWGACCLGS